MAVIPNKGPKDLTTFHEMKTNENHNPQRLMSQKSNIRIMAVDSQVLVRDALVHRLGSEPEMEIVGVARGAEEAVALVQASRPDVILMDAQLSGLSCFDGVRRMRGAGLSPQVVLLSTRFHDQHLLEGLDVGARGFVLKSESIAGLLNAIQEVAAGGSYLSKEVDERLIRDSSGSLTLKPVNRILSPREMQVLRYLAKGYAKKFVAEMMGISVKTVEGHAQHLMRKLDIHNRVDLARYAIREGLVSA